MAIREKVRLVTDAPEADAACAPSAASRSASSQAAVAWMYSSTTEAITIVDADNREIGISTRRHMRRHRLWHRCVYILLFDPAGRLLIHQRTATKDVFPSCWDVAFGGVVDAGEQFAAAAARELGEEAGITAGVEFLFEMSFDDASTRVFGQVFRCVTRDCPSFQAEEVAAAEWRAVEEVRALIGERRFCPDGVEVFDAFAKRSDSVRGGCA